MGEIFTEERLRGLRMKKKFKMDGSFIVVDELEAASHLVRATIMACESIEDMQERNALVALLAEIESRVDGCAEYLKNIKKDSPKA